RGGSQPGRRGSSVFRWSRSHSAKNKASAPMKTEKSSEAPENRNLVQGRLRTVREGLATGYRRELQKHEPGTEAHLELNWAPTLIHALIEDAFVARASDIHIEPEAD